MEPKWRRAPYPKAQVGAVSDPHVMAFRRLFLDGVARF